MNRVRRLALAGAATVLTIGCSGPDLGTGRPAGVDPGRLITDLTDGLTAGGPYRDPYAREASWARQAARLLLDEPDNLTGQDSIFARLGFGSLHADDPVTGRPFSLFMAGGSDRRAWGALLVDRSAPANLLIGVPHPRSDINTERLGIALHRQVPGSVLLVAGAHRNADGAAGDVAHNADSVFHVLAREFAVADLPQLQLHGFADQSLPGAQAVVSTGAAPVSVLAHELADRLAEAGLVTCRAWAADCAHLEGTRNVQGQAAAELGAGFIHLELGWSVRGDPSSANLAVRAVAELFRPTPTVDPTPPTAPPAPSRAPAPPTGRPPADARLPAQP